MKKIFLSFLLLLEISLVPVVVEKSLRDVLHNGISSYAPIIKMAPMSPNDDYPEHLIKSYKAGVVLSRKEKRIVCNHLHQQIELNYYNFSLWHSEHAPLLLRFFGYATIALRYGIYQYIRKYSEWEKLLEEISIEVIEKNSEWEKLLEEINSNC